MKRRALLAQLSACALLLVLAGCGDVTRAGSGGRPLVVAAENFWGSIATQLAGDRVQVQSIIVNPAQDPHSYEPTPSDARLLAMAQLAVVNGAGYDPWASRLLAAAPSSGRAVLDVGHLLGLGTGANPHRWYDPSDVAAVTDAITAALIRIDPHDRSYFTQRRAVFTRQSLARYHSLISAIRTRYHGVPVGASESIFALMAPSLGLRLLTPPSFMKAIAEGTDVTASDLITTQRQITEHRIRAWVYNDQNTTPQIQQLNALARAHGIPISTISETLTPPGVSFQTWQVAELERLASALREATGR